MLTSCNNVLTFFIARSISITSNEVLIPFIPHHYSLLMPTCSHGVLRLDPSFFQVNFSLVSFLTLKYLLIKAARGVD